MHCSPFLENAHTHYKERGSYTNSVYYKERGSYTNSVYKERGSYTNSGERFLY